MGLGILNDTHYQIVPGTAHLQNEPTKRSLALDASQRHLKYDKTGTTLLVPQPSEDPNDPLVRATTPPPSCAHPTTPLTDNRTGRSGNAT